MHISGQLIPTIRQLNTWPRFRLRLFAEGALVGVFAGLTAGFFRFALEKGTLLREYIYTILIQSDLWVNLLWFAALAAVGYVLWRCVLLMNLMRQEAAYRK